MLGTVQGAIANGVLDAVRAGDIPKDKVNDLGIIVSVWLNPSVIEDKALDLEELLGVGPELRERAPVGVGLPRRRGVVEDPVLDGEPVDRDLGRASATDHLGPDRVVGGEDHRLVVGGVQAVHAEVVPGHHHEVAGDRGHGVVDRVVGSVHWQEANFVTIVF